MIDESNTCLIGDRSAEDRVAAARGIEARGYSPPPRQLAAFAGSIAAHALIMCAIVLLAARAHPHGHEWVLAYMIDLGAARGVGGDSGGSMLPGRFDPGPASPPDDASPAPRLPRHPHRSHHHAPPPRVVASAPAPPIETESHGGIDQKKAPEASITAAAPSAAANNPGSATTNSNHPESNGGSGAHGAALGAGTGSGAGAGDGAGGITIARADYGSDPAPLYPSRSRRRGEQGTVMLRVLIAASGAVEQVELFASSGFRDLDDQALETVRRRWKFVPARRDGVAFESWAVVPIRFALTEVSN
ncbi:MAG: energy transducer TonB [Candidatus Binataceae bacterium]